MPARCTFMVKTGAALRGKKVHVWDQAVSPVSDPAREVRFGIKKVHLETKRSRPKVRFETKKKVHFMVKTYKLQLIAFFGNNHPGWANQFAF